MCHIFVPTTNIGVIASKPTLTQYLVCLILGGIPFKWLEKLSLLAESKSLNSEFDVFTRLDLNVILGLLPPPKINACISQQFCSSVIFQVQMFPHMEEFWEVACKPLLVNNLTS
jgi:hypothetical protein